MTGIGAQVVAEAREWLGTPYVHQASVKGCGTDCLGLLRGVWRAVMGSEPQEIPPYTWDWAEPAGDEILAQAGARHLLPATGPMAPGDVLLFRMRIRGVAKHLGIVGDTDPACTFIHAYSGHGVVENTLTQPWARRIALRFRFPDRRP